MPKLANQLGKPTRHAWRLVDKPNGSVAYVTLVEDGYLVALRNQHRYVELPWVRVPAMKATVEAMYLMMVGVA